MIFGTSAYVNPGERGREGRAGWASEDGLPDHITRGCDGRAAILQGAPRIGVRGERNTDARVYFHVNRRILCIIAVKCREAQAARHLSFFRIEVGEGGLEMMPQR